VCGKVREVYVKVREVCGKVREVCGKVIIAAKPTNNENPGFHLYCSTYTKLRRTYVLA